MVDVVELAHKAHLLYKTQNLEEAMAFVDASISQGGCVYAWYVKGCILQQLKNYSESIVAYKNGLKGNPSDICCLKGITTSYFLMEDYSGAMHWAKTRLQLLGPSKSAYNMLAKLKLRVAEYSQAIEFYQKSLSVKVEDDTLVEMADVYVEIQEYENAINVINQALEVSHESADNMIKLAQIYEQMGNMEKALEVIDSVVTKDRFNIKAVKYYGQLNYKLGNLDKAMTSFHFCLKMDENNFDTMQQLSLCYFDRKKYLLAVALLEIAHELKPNDSITLFQIAKCLYYIDRKIAAMYYLKECLSIGWNSEAHELLKVLIKDLQIK